MKILLVWFPHSHMVSAEPCNMLHLSLFIVQPTITFCKCVDLVLILVPCFNLMSSMMISFKDMTGSHDLHVPNFECRNFSHLR